MNKLSGRKFAVITANYYFDLAHKFMDGTTRKFVELGGNMNDLEQFHVPGSFEIPQVLNRLIKLRRYDAILCFGIVIRGETAHFDYICYNVTRGVGEIAQNADIPVIFAVLTTDTKVQALARLGGGHSHKGEEAVESASMMIQTLKETKLIKRV